MGYASFCHCTNAELLFVVKSTLAKLAVNVDIFIRGLSRDEIEFTRLLSLGPEKIGN
jgi:hypothetical protein